MAKGYYDNRYGSVYFEGRMLTTEAVVSDLNKLIDQLAASKERLAIERQAAKEQRMLMQEVERLAYKAIGGNTVRYGDELN